MTPGIYLHVISLHIILLMVLIMRRVGADSEALPAQLRARLRARLPSQRAAVCPSPGHREPPSESRRAQPDSSVQGHRPLLLPPLSPVGGAALVSRLKG